MSDFQAALAELSTLKRGTERLEEHLKSLYITNCAKCRQEVQAEYFLYHRGESSPFARSYLCPDCNDSGQKPVIEEDLERLVALQRSYPMHRSRALEWASTGTDDSIKIVNDVLNLYPPRAIYFIFTLLNKIDAMKADTNQEAIFDALLISILDAGHSLNPWPESEELPRSLAQPADYIERNLWLVMENAATEWVEATLPVNISAWPELPDKAGLSLHRGRMRELVVEKHPVSPTAIFSTIPRPYAAFWTFSAVWSAWLWGKEDAAGFLGILERRRFDWSWHSAALQSAFSSASKLMPKESPILALLPEPSSGLSNAVFNAASASAWKLTGIACADDSLPLQCRWTSETHPASTGKANTQRIIRDAIRQNLIDTGEPQSYTFLHAGIMAALAGRNCLPADLAQLRDDITDQISKDVAAIFADAKFLRHLKSASSDPETGYWWLAQLAQLPDSVSDRIENALVEYLQQKTRVDFLEAVDYLCSRFTGFQSPSFQEVTTILSSYAKVDPATGKWLLNEHDTSLKRAQDVKTIQRLIREAGAKLGYVVSGENPIDWDEPGESGATAYRLFTSATAGVGQLAKLPAPLGCQYVYLFPGSRAVLIKSRIDGNPLLQEITAENWHFLKFRTMRHLAVRTDLSREIWALLIDSDPISLEETTQLSMFNQ